MKIPLKIGILIWVMALTFLTGCGDSTDTTTNAATTSATATTSTTQDRAAILAAQSALRNAQMVQEQYYVDNERYAKTAVELKSKDSHLNPKIEITSGSAHTYEMKLTASDSQNTVYIIRQTGNRVERVDGEGDPW